MAAHARKLLSYASGASTRPLLGETIGQIFDRTVARLPSHTALVSRHDGVRWTYAEFADNVDRAAAGLLRLGLRRGDNIAVWALNGSDWATLQYASAKAGLGLLKLNPAFRATELKYALNKVGAKALVTAHSFKTSHFDAIVREVVPELDAPGARPGHLASAAVPSLQHVVTLGAAPVGDGFAARAGAGAAAAPPQHGSMTCPAAGMHRWADLVASSSVGDVVAMQAASEELDSDDIISLQLTSGTTGLPKATQLSHHNFVNNAALVGANIGLSEADKVLANPPLFHCMGCVMSSASSVVFGATALYAAPAFDAGAALALAASEGATSIHGVPTMFIAMLSHADEPALRKKIQASARTGIMAGSICPVELMRQVERQWNLRELVINYGMTETSPVSTATARDDPEWARTETVGRVMPHTEIKVVDPATGRIVPRGTSGELCSRGYLVMRGGYMGDPAKTAESITNGWMHTGDLASMDDAGYVRIVGRIKDMIIRGGENVFPREVEDYLFTHPAVKDVSVFGVADPVYGEAIAARVILRDGFTAGEDVAHPTTSQHPRWDAHAGDGAGTKMVTAGDIRAFCHGRIAAFKVPKYIEFAADFPKTASGKIQKFVMRAELEEKLGLANKKQ